MVRGGFYIVGLDMLYCTSETTCIHEQAHRFDAQNGFISSSIDYQVAVTSYTMTNTNGMWSHEIINYQSSWSELYAQMYQAVDGNVSLMPVELQRFYQ